jgi:hypothetical protein
MSWVFSSLLPISTLFASSRCRLLIYLIWWKIRSLMPWAIFIELLHLLLQVHKSWIFHFLFISFDTLYRFMLSIDICRYFLTLKCVPRIHIFTLIQAHLLVELLFELIKFVWLFSFSRHFMKVLIFLLSMLYLSVVYFEHLFFKIFFVFFRRWHFFCKDLNRYSLVFSFFASKIICLPQWRMHSGWLIEALLFSLSQRII